MMITKAAASSFMLFFAFLFFVSASHAKSVILKPQPFESFKINKTQVYAPRLDDPSVGTFERCSKDTYNIIGPCLYEVCYLYLYRSGYDGWIPDTVEVYGYYTGSVTFYYNTNIPNDVWYGFNYCSDASASGRATKWFGPVLQLLFCVAFWKLMFGSV